MRAPIGTPALALVTLATLATLIAPTAVSAEPAGDVIALSSNLQLHVRGGREIELTLLLDDRDKLERGVDYADLAERVSGDRAAGPALAAANRGTRARAGNRIRVPFALLSTEYRSLVLRTLFPDDRREGGDWIHVAQSGALPTYDEGLWQVAEWFTGDGANFERLMKVNALSTPELRRGQVIRVPADVLDEAFRAHLASDDGALEFARDAAGPFAGYRLRRGEALYSAVVLRFTGRTGSADVTEVADALKARNDIPDLHDIPAGFLIKIPVDLVEPHYLPAGHPRRVEADARAAELARELARKPMTVRTGLEGVLVILDAGHGGRDLGTMNNGIWEHDYVYDVTCRLKDKLERTTAARVVLTLEDAQTGCVPSQGDVLEANKQGTVLTTPPFLAREQGEAKIGVNLRWYLANSIYRKALADGYAADRVIFMSLHADSRHPSLSGVMVYVPGEQYVTRTYGKTSAPYSKYREVREQPHVSFSKQQRVRSEALSRRYADAVVKAFGEEGLPVQPYQPVRDRIIRGKQRFVPAVLRGNQVPSKVLVEMVNLSNPEDATLLARAAERDRLSRGLLRSLLQFYGDHQGGAPSRHAGLTAP